LKLEKHLSKTFTHTSQIAIGDMEVYAFNKFHDAVDPYSFMISCSGVNVGVFTDIGRPCANLIHHFKQCHAAFLESNYDDVMLQNGNYPYFLKQRITGGLGHLSNKEALDLFKTHRSSSLSHLFLSHLSKNNNCPKLVQTLFDDHSEGVKMVVASRFEETPVFHISGDVNLSSKHISKTVSKPTQLQLSFI
jgi:phosphoribosyl 1,2-cyclic phosphodiesterase